MTPAIKKLNRYLASPATDALYLSRRDAEELAEHVAKADAALAKMKRFHASMGNFLVTEEIEE